MKSTKQIIVAKRDGSLERFSMAKLTNCLDRVMRGRAYDPALARPLTRAVAMHLRDWRNANPPSTDYVYRCVRTVLQQTGLSDVATDLAAHRRLRRLRRRRIRVLATGHAIGPGEPWHKIAIVATLQNRFGLGQTVARFIASQIEKQVFALGYRLVSKTFLAELVRNEVLAWGLADAQALRLEDSHCEPPPVATRRSDKES